MDGIHGTVDQQVELEAPLSLTWSAFADSAFRATWFSLPGDRESRSHALDFRVGGEELTRSTFNNVDHLEHLELRSRLLDIVPQRRITAASTFRLNDVVRIVTLTTTTFEAVGGGTRFMLRRLSIALAEATAEAKS